MNGFQMRIPRENEKYGVPGRSLDDFGSTAFIARNGIIQVDTGNTYRGSFTVRLTSCLTDLECNLCWLN